jgi:GNAT superfamily N-acetyltransferase
MNTDFKIELISFGQMETILPLVFMLNNEKITYAILKKRLEEILTMGGYECIGVYNSGELVGICGLWVLNKLYVGKHVEPDNVFIKKEYRSSGVGQLMMDFLFQYAKEIGCEGSEVNCYITNEKGQKFWKRQGYKPLAYHYFMKFDEKD